MLKKLCIVILFLFTQINCETIEQSSLKLAKDFKCKQNEILKAFDAFKLDFKKWNILDSIKKDNFNFIKFSNAENLENEIIRFVDVLRKNQIGNFTKINVDDLKEHAKLRIVFKKYLKNSQNALFYYNPLLDEALIIGLSQSFIVFTFLKFSSYYTDSDNARFIKQIYLRYFVYERATGKTRDY